MYAPIARIILRYGVGVVIGTEIGNTLAGDPDVVMYVAAGIGLMVEASYTLAVKKGWSR